MPNLDGRIKIYTNFKDINKSCPKDDFPLPNINTLVDNMMGHEMFSLMDEFFRYNKIMISKENKHKMAFTTPWGTYYYRVMLFGINNAGAIPVGQ